MRSSPQQRAPECQNRANETNSAIFALSSPENLAAGRLELPHSLGLALPSDAKSAFARYQKSYEIRHFDIGMSIRIAPRLRFCNAFQITHSAPDRRRTVSLGRGRRLNYAGSQSMDSVGLGRRLNTSRQDLYAEHEPDKDKDSEDPPIGCHYGLAGRISDRR
jgi:hypothetical protein